MKITFVNQTRLKITNAKRLSRILNRIITILASKKLRHKKMLKQKKEIIFVFLTPMQMKKINSQFRGKNNPTDILSFTSSDRICLGELLFCLPVLKKQAKEQNHTIEAELAYMIIHGVLHLLGYDHEISEGEQTIMFDLQDSCFAQVRHLLS